MNDQLPKVGEVWIDQDPRVTIKRAEITEVTADRVYYTRGARKANSDLKRFTKAFKREE